MLGARNGEESNPRHPLGLLKYIIYMTGHPQLLPQTSLKLNWAKGEGERQSG